MAEGNYYIVKQSSLTKIADAIREKGGTSESLSFPNGFVSAVEAISGGGEGYTIDDIAERNMMSGNIYGGSASFIASYAFYCCSSLITVSFPMATSIGSFAFASCTSLITASFPMVTSIFSNVFTYCSHLTTVSFPIVTSMGSYAFYSCTSLRAVSLPAITSIEGYAFARCFRLVSLYLNGISNVPTLKANAFSSTPIGGYTTSTNGVYGSVFVPASLYSAFRTATNWSSISVRIVSV